MSKKIIAVAAALIAGSTFANAANAGVRVGFGFPLGSFMARETMGYGERDCERPSYQSRRSSYPAQPQARRVYRAPVVAQPRYVAPAVVAQPVAQPVAQAPQAAPAEKQASKLSDTPVSQANTTEIAKTPADEVATNEQTEVSTTAILARAPEGATKNGASTMTKDVTSLPEVVVESKPAKVASAATETKKSDLKTVAISTDQKKVCRRFSAAVGGLVETACD